MAVLGRKYIDSWNYLELGYDILKQENYSTTYRRYVYLYVAGNVSWSNAVARFNNPDAHENLQYSYGPGKHLLISQDVTVQHDSSGYHTENISGSITSGLAEANWYFNTDVEFPRISEGATINTFTGRDIYSSFKATYTPAQGKSYEYKLRISVPYVVALQTYDNYISGQEVTFSQHVLDWIKSYTQADKLTVGGVIESWYGSNKVGESEEIEIQVFTKKRNNVKVKVNGEWKDAVPYVRVNGEWKEATPYLRINNQWKEGI